MKSRFIGTINDYRSLHLEDVSVSGNEKSALPDVEDEDLDSFMDTEDEPSEEFPQEEIPNDVDQPNGGAFTDREVDILNVALQIFRDNPNFSIEQKNDLSNIFEEEDYDGLLGRLISIADELS